MIKSRIPLEKFVKEYSVRNKLNEDIPVKGICHTFYFVYSLHLPALALFEMTDLLRR